MKIRSRGESRVVFQTGKNPIWRRLQEPVPWKRRKNHGTHKPKKSRYKSLSLPIAHLPKPVNIYE